MDVTDVLRDRMHEPAGLQRMAAVSVLLHGLVAAVAILGPGGWFAQQADPPRDVMTISLDAGTPGPQSGGLTAIGGRAVQVATPDPPKRPEPIRPPAEKAPAMTVPERGARARGGATDVKE